MAIADNANMSTSLGLDPSYQGALNGIMKREMDENLVFAQFGVPYTIPKNSGTTSMKVRRYKEFDASTTRLEEGVPPTAQTLEQENVTMTVDAYGNFVKVTDKLNMTALDKPMKDAVGLLSRQAAKSQDRIVEQELANNCTNRQYANGKTARHLLTTGTDFFKIEDIKKAVLNLQRNNVEQIKGEYIGICSPDVAYDIQNDQLFIDIAKYQSATKMYNNEIGKLWGVRWVMTTAIPPIEAADLLGESATMTVASYTNKVITVDEAISADEATALAGRKVIIGAKVYEIASAASGVAGSATVTLKDTPTTNPADNDVIYPAGAGAAGGDVLLTFVMGAEAFAKVSLAGGGAPTIIVKPMGSAGTEDPLNQVGTVGYKIEGFGAKLLNQSHIVVIESAPRS